ncbi:MAG: DsbE family thiol:disulfide interchange protein [Bauldia sp.]
MTTFSGQTPDDATPAAPSSTLFSRRNLLRLVPIGVFGGLAATFGVALVRNQHGIVRSALIGDQVPEFSLSPVQGRTLGLASENLRGEVTLVNVFASWCAPCRVEHPLFLELRDRGVVTIHGINHKDKPDDAAAWLDRLGDPFTRTGADIDGRVSIDWGVYGVPETFVVDAGGVIAHKHVGPLNETVLQQTIVPLIERLRT